MDNRIWVQIMCPSCACMFDSVVSVADYAKRIAELEAKLANAQKLADVLLDERNEEVKKVAYWSKAYDDAKRGAWNAAIEAAEKSCDDNKHPESDAVGDEWIADHNETCAGCASRIRELKK